VSIAQVTCRCQDVQGCTWYWPSPVICFAVLLSSSICRRAPERWIASARAFDRLVDEEVGVLVIDPASGQLLLLGRAADEQVMDEGRQGFVVERDFEPGPAGAAPSTPRPGYGVPTGRGHSHSAVITGGRHRWLPRLARRAIEGRGDRDREHIWQGLLVQERAQAGVLAVVRVRRHPLERGVVLDRRSASPPPVAAWSRIPLRRGSRRP
jgi:hypothetical protein